MAAKTTPAKQFPKWAVPVGIGAIVLLLLLRLRSAGSSTRAAQSFGGAVGLGGGAADTRTVSSAQDLLSQQVADALTLQKAQQTIISNRFQFGKQLTANKQVGCPGGGTPRFDPETFTWGCQQEKHGPTGLNVILDPLTQLGNAATRLYQDWLGASRGTGGLIPGPPSSGGYAGYPSYGGVGAPRSGGGYTPGINGDVNLGGNGSLTA